MSRTTLNEATTTIPRIPSQKASGADSISSGCTLLNLAQSHAQLPISFRHRARTTTTKHTRSCATLSVFGNCMGNKCCAAVGSAPERLSQANNTLCHSRRFTIQNPSGLGRPPLVRQALAAAAKTSSFNLLDLSAPLNPTRGPLARGAFLPPPSVKLRMGLGPWAS